jgi:choline monooxygenase
MELIFQQGPRYVGHELAVPEIGDYHALPQEGEGRALVRTPKGVELISNVCRHRQAVMLRGRGSVQRPGVGRQHRVPAAPLDLQRRQGAKAGTLLGAPHFATDPCLNLNNYRLQNWNGLLFEANGFDVPRTLAKLGPKADLDFSGYVLDRVEMHEVDYNWKTFIEVYLEDYHVGPFHPGLGNFVTCEDLRWEFGPSTRCRRWAWPASWARPARTCTASGTTKCCATRKAARPSTARSGSRSTRT